MEDIEPVLIYPESVEDLRQKLVNATLELETTKNLKTELFNLLMMAYQERDEARGQLQKLMNKLMASNTTHLQNVFGGVQHESHLMLPAAKANSSITESSSLSHGSPPVDSFFDSVSSPEFSNITNNKHISYLNQHLVQDFNSSASDDPATAVIDSLAKGRALPPKGKFLQAVMDAGPLLQTALLAGPLPTWRNPPPLQNIKVPPLSITSSSTELNSFADTGNSFLKPKLPSLCSLNATLSTSTCSGSMLNFAGHPSSSFNNTWHLTSTSNVSIQSQSRKRQRHQ